jgi:hypothetical protein
VLLAWLVFPLVMLAVSVGCGLIVERLAGLILPGTILASVGLALVIVISTLGTAHEVTAPLTPFAVVIVAVIGYVTAWPRLRSLGSREYLRSLRPDGWALGTGVAVFAVCAAPIVLSGNATWLGYFVDNDAAFHLSLIAQLLSHGHDLTRLANSSYVQILHEYLTSSYPIGADVALGALRPLVGQDAAWLYQPYLAVIMALGGAALYELLREVIVPAPLRALSAFIAAQAGLLYAYYLESSIKELATTWLITLTVVLVVTTLRAEWRVRRVLPLLIVVVAALDVLNLAVAPWLAPPLAVFVVVVIWRQRHVVRQVPPRRLALYAAGILVVMAALAAPLISRVSTFVQVATAVLTSQGDLGNLVSPLSKWEMVGIWPVGDFRFPLVNDLQLGYVLIGVAVASGLIGVVWAIRRRRYAVLLLVAGNGIAAAYLLSRANAYASGKVMMIFSLTSITAAMLGPASLHDSGRRVEAWLLAAAISGGVLWTNALGYSDASVAPRARFAELSAIDARFAHQGTTFYNLSDEFALYFLRDMAPVDPADSPPQPRVPSAAPQGRAPWDTDELALPYLESFHLLVLANSPLASRPPANYQLVMQGRYYDVWRQTPSPHVVAHIPISGPLFPVAVPACRVIMNTARQAARDHAQLAYVQRAPVPTLVPTQTSHPPNWGLVGGDPFSLIPRDQPGTAAGKVDFSQGGTYQIRVEGDISQRLQIFVDGRHVGSIAYELAPPGQVEPAGRVTLSAGQHIVEVVRPGNNLAPGDGGTTRTLGPVMFVRSGAAPPVAEIAPSRARSLCGRSLDWLEIVT